MAIDWDEAVLAPSMSADVFGEAEVWTFTPAGGVSFQFTPVFDRPYKAVVMDADGEPAIATAEPAIGVRMAEFATAPVKGDAVRDPVTSQRYVVADVQPDGKGFARLPLNKTA